MPAIDTVGTFRGRIVASAVGSTKNGFPQWIVSLVATQKFVTEKYELDHYKLTEPGWVDRSEDSETAMGYLVLFNSKDEFTEATALFHLESVMNATGWDGASFSYLNGDATVGREVLFRMEENEYNGKTSIRLAGVDDKDASPTRTLKALDANEVKNMDGKLRLTAKAKPAAKAAKAAKPVGKPTTQTVPATSTAKPVDATIAEAAPTTTTPTAPTKKAPTPKAKAAKTEGMTRDEAWEYVNANKGDNDDATVEDAWLSISGEIQGDRLAEDLTPADYKKIADLVLKDLG